MLMTTTRTLLIVAALSVAPRADAILGQAAVVDPERGQVFVALADGTLGGYSIADGSQNWVSDRASRPLAIEASLLWAQDFDIDQPNRLTVVGIDPGSGIERARLSADLPTEVRALVDDALGEQFQVRRLAGPGLRMAWQWHYRLIQGALLEETPPAPRFISGELVIDAAADEIQTLPASDATLALFEQPLHRSPDTPIAGVEDRQFLASVGDAVLASRVTEQDSWLRYQWALYDAAGQALGTTLMYRAWAPFAVPADDRLVYLSEPHERTVEGELRAFPRTLVGVNLASGQTLWRIEIRDTTYRGPWPP